VGQLWTIIFGTIIAIAFGLAAWHDREEAKLQERKKAAHDKRNRAED
jgi:hypothetical protein